MSTNVTIQKDFYKAGHPEMFPDNTQMMYNNFTPRKSRMKGVNKVVVFGIQYFILEYLIKQWNEDFFKISSRKLADTMTEISFNQLQSDIRDRVISKYKRMMDYTLGKDSVSTKHLEDIWDLGYLPLEIKALPEGTLCPIGVPMLTYKSTHPAGFFLPGMLETILSTTIWQPTTSATIAYEYKKLLTRYALETTGSADFVQFQGHDFSMRGMSSLESACTSGAGHLLSFVGTDTIPAIAFLEDYYGANIENELVGTSVPATEHSVMCMGQQNDEIETFRRLLRIYEKSPFLSVVSDTWDLTQVVKPKGGYLSILKDEIMVRDGKLVIRPDSGDPADIICGHNRELTERERQASYPEFYNKGLVECLAEIFGYTINDKGYKVLDPHIGAIYGDSITLERAEDICRRLREKGFASTNIVFGIGSYTYQYNTRDTFGFAVKATYGEVLTKTHCDNFPLTCKGYNECLILDKREIWKDPITDSGEKKSKKGLLMVHRDGFGNIVCEDQCTKIEERVGLLKTVFLNGKLVKFQTLAEIRAKLNSYGG